MLVGERWLDNRGQTLADVSTVTQQREQSRAVFYVCVCVFYVCVCVCVFRPPSTATVIGIQGDGESLLEERRGGDAQKGLPGESGHAPSHSLALLRNICRGA